MNSFRLWYPQLDIYDAIRRMAHLLSAASERTFSSERLYILDFYLANPPLLHLTHMPSEMRKKFGALRISRPEKLFLSYPAPPLLFQKMEAVQRDSLSTMLAKGLVVGSDATSVEVRLSELGKRVASEQLAALLSETESRVLPFLQGEFATIGADDVTALHRATGLRRAGR